MNNQTGLSTDLALSRLKQFGLNQLPSKKATNALKLLLAQFSSPLVWLLLIASIFSFFIGDQIDGFLILLIFGLNTALGFWQEYKASRELEALRKMEVSVSRVIRNGEEIKIPSLELVPGDLIILESGDKVPADGRIIESFDLSVNEAALTGESMPILKTAANDENSIYFGSTIVAGRGKMEILETGARTRFGKIAISLSEVIEEPTPLEVSLNDLAKKAGLLAIIIASFVFILRILQGNETFDVLLSSIALMVAAVPEGLPAVITVLLAVGVSRMYKKKTLVRKMDAIESLGATEVILTDKTGTLTKNEMSVRKIYSNKSQLPDLIKTAVVANSANIVLKEDHGSFDILGDTTEGALLVWANEQKVDISGLRSSGKIAEESPFDLKRRRMSVLWEDNDGLTLHTKGAPEVVLALCSLTGPKLKELTQTYTSFAKEGLRVLAFARKENIKGGEIIAQLEKDMEFLGFVGIADSPRPEAKDAIEKAHRAGIAVVMVTGDNELTAKAIAEEIGLLKEGDEIMTGETLEAIDDEQLKVRLEKIRIFARVIPEHKLRIVRAYQMIDKTVAVTGDGVNDSLALKAAHVGVAMGKTGTDVAKEAADIVILDDNLETLVKAIEQGRLVYSNILKVSKFLMTGNLSEVLVIFTAALAGFPTPFLPTQILWINFVTDGLPALALAMDSASPAIMNSSPKSIPKRILDRAALLFIFSYGTIIALVCLGLFLIFLAFFDLATARTAVFSIMVTLQMALVFLMRRHHTILSNKYLLGSVTLILIVQALITFVPTLSRLFN